MSVVREWLIDTVATIKRLATGESITKEPKIERMWVKHIINHGKENVVKSIDHSAAVPNQKSKTRKRHKRGFKSRKSKKHVTKYDAVPELNNVPSRLSIGQLYEKMQ